MGDLGSGKESIAKVSRDVSSFYFVSYSPVRGAWEGHPVIGRGPMTILGGATALWRYSLKSATTTSTYNNLLLFPIVLVPYIPRGILAGGKKALNI